MKVAIAGSSGFVGSRLVPYLVQKGIEVIKLVRCKEDRKTVLKNSGQIFWNPDEGFIDIENLEAARIDAIVNLAGENVHKRWNERTKARLIQSRLASTELLAKTILTLKNRPKVLISASGISFYHNLIAIQLSRQEGNESIPTPEFDETSKPGSGFLSELCQRWEAASKTNDLQSHIRVVNLRIGVAMGLTGGVLQKLVPLFRWGLGGKWGDGSQHLSWIGIDDLVRIVHYILTNDDINGPVNAVTPYSATNEEFIRELGKTLHRSTPFTVPSWLARLLFGDEWVESTLLADYKIKPTVLMKHGFHFNDPQLGPFLAKELARTNQS